MGRYGHTGEQWVFTQIGNHTHGESRVVFQICKFDLLGHFETKRKSPLTKRSVRYPAARFGGELLSEREIR